MLIVVLIALLLAAATAVAFLLNRARNEADGLRLLVEMSGLLQVSPSLRNAVEIVPVFGRRLFPSIDGALYVGDGQHFELTAGWGDTARHARLHDGDCEATHGTAASDDAGGPRCDVADGATLCLPLASAGETVAILTLRASNGSALASRTTLFGRTFADHIAVALANLRMQELLRNVAQRDSLTGAYNRRYMEETLGRELKSARRRHAQTGAIVVDVDRFKWFNDTYGHGGGDALLQQLVRVMQGAFSGPGEFVCRYGGDEFVIVVPATSAEALRSRAERLCASLRDLHVHADGRVLGSVTISTGFACAPDHADDVQGLIAAADHALYEAKTAGRDRVGTPPPRILGRDAA